MTVRGLGPGETSPTVANPQVDAQTTTATTAAPPPDPAARAEAIHVLIATLPAVRARAEKFAEPMRSSALAHLAKLESELKQVARGASPDVGATAVPAPPAATSPAAPMTPAQVEGELKDLHAQRAQIAKAFQAEPKNEALKQALQKLDQRIAHLQTQATQFAFGQKTKEPTARAIVDTKLGDGKNKWRA